MKTSLLFAFFIVSSYIQAQFKPDYTKNFWEQVQKWDSFYDSVALERKKQGIDNMKGTGFNKYNQWKQETKMFIPENGSFEDAIKTRASFQETLENEAVSGLSDKISTAWTSVGPNNYGDMEMYYGSTWQNPHVNGIVTRFDASVGRFNEIYKHPTDINTLFACGAGGEASGGGLYRSTDYGNTWSIMGTDLIPYPNVRCFNVKPASIAPNIGTEIWIIGLECGSVYRSTNYGGTWVNINNFVPGVSGIESFANTNNNIVPWGLQGSFVTNITFIPDASSTYGVAVISGLNGVYYSSNYADPTATSIVWNKFNFTMPPNYNPTAYSAYTFSVFSDVEYYTKSGSHYVVANMVKCERDVAGTILSHRNYMFTSPFTLGSHATLTLQSLGAITSGPNSSSNYLFDVSNIEVKSTDPNFIFVAYNGGSKTSFPIYRYDLSTNVWVNRSPSALGGSHLLASNGIYPTSHCLTIDPNNDNIYYIFTENDKKYVNDVLMLNVSAYGERRHGDTQDALLDTYGGITTIWTATDGGIYKSTDDAITFTPKSMGFNSAQISSVSVGQKPPFYVAAGVWHGGAIMLDPATQKWHHWRNGDGTLSHISFLNPNKVFFWDQSLNGGYLTNGYNTNYDVLPTTGALGVSMVTSENTPGLAYSAEKSIYSSFSTYNLRKSNSDFALGSTSLVTIPGYNTTVYANRFPNLHMPSNETDKLVIVDCSIDNLTGPSDRILFVKDMNTSPVIDLIVNTPTITTNTGISTQDFKYEISLVLDPLNYKKFWMVYRPYPVTPTDLINRIVCFNPTTSQYTDYTYRMEGNANFPDYITITSIDMDRQTGILYIGTSQGVYYLDESNPADKVWIKYSTNVPYYNTSLTINHCLGEIYTAAYSRGIWKAPLMRTGVAAREWHITTNETWTSRKNLYCTLILDPGVTLTVKSDLMIFGYQKIIVKRGAQLIIDGGKITTECGNMWQGVYVEGNNTGPQTVSVFNQGKVSMINNAILEHSHNGIANYGLDASGNIDWSKTGGIIDINNSKFYNNRRAIEFQAYTYGNSISKINNSLFETNAQLNDAVSFPNNNGIEAFVTMNDIDGVLFEGNTFKNTYSTGLVGANFGLGIRASEAVFNVGPSTTGLGNTFDNLFRGVELTRTTLTPGTLLINNNIFNNCRVGVYLTGNATLNNISGNTFTKSGLPAYTTSNGYYGILTDATRSFNIAFNTFTNQSFGCFIKNSSTSSDPMCSVFSNIFTDNYRSITSQYNNFKLSIKCNTFNNPNSVAQMYWLNYNGISNQGSCTSASTLTGNLFYNPLPVEKDIYNFTGAPLFTYYHHNATTSPTTLSDIIPVIHTAGTGVTLTPCSYTFNASTSCEIIIPIQNPDQNNTVSSDNTQTYHSMETGVYDNMSANQKNKNYAESEQLYQAVLARYANNPNAPLEITSKEYYTLYETALVDSTVLGANCRGLFIFFYKKEFDNYFPEGGNGSFGDNTAVLGDKPILFQNVPNPSNNSTSIKVYLPEKNGVLEVANVSGQIVKTIALNNETNMINLDKNEIGTGIFFYALKVNGTVVDTKKLIMLK